MGIRLLAWVAAGALIAAPVRGIEIYPLDQVRAGLRGEGLTVLAGEQMTRFGVEVLGLMPSFIGPGQDLILARLEGDALEYHGVVSGMSGSPVYVDGKLLGAVAYRLGAFSKEPIAGITPAALMLRGTAGTPARASARAQLDVAAFGSVVPIETPIMFGGAPPGLLGRYEEALRAQGLVPVRAPGARRPRRAEPRAPGVSFSPGGPMAGLLIDGDLSVAAIGTVTHVEGNRVVGFGHAFLGRGLCQIPLAEAEVVATLPSLAGSAKLANATRVVGVIEHDRSIGVSATVGPRAPVLSVAVEVSGAEEELRRDARRRFNFSLLEDPMLTPLLVEIAVAAALGGRVGFESGGSARLQAEISLPGRPPLILREFVSVPDGGSVAAVGAGWLAQRLAPLWVNPYQPLTGVSVKLRAHLERQPRSARVLGARISPPAARPGQRVVVSVDLLDYRERRRRLERAVVLPPELEPGKLKLHVGARAFIASVDRLAGRLPTPTSLDDEIANLERARRADRLYLALVRDETGLQVDGRPLPALPPSMHAILGRTAKGPERRALTRLIEWEEAIDIGAQVEKGISLDLDVLPRESPP